jgi:hypothetical protein
LPSAKYGRLVNSYNAQAAQAKWDDAAQTLATLKAELDKMDTAKGYWKSAALKGQYFTPILKAVEGHQTLVDDKRAG